MVQVKINGKYTCTAWGQIGTISSTYSPSLNQKIFRHGGSNANEYIVINSVGQVSSLTALNNTECLTECIYKKQ